MNDYIPDYLDEHVEKTLPAIYKLVKDQNMGVVIDRDLINEMMQGGFDKREALEMLERGRKRGIIPK